MALIDIPPPVRGFKTKKTKQCSACGEVRSAAKFYNDPNSEDGKVDRCYSCSVNQRRSRWMPIGKHQADYHALKRGFRP